MLNPPKLTNNPSWDVIVTETTPLLSFFNAEEGSGIKYELEIDKSEKFDSSDLSKYSIIQRNKFVTDQKILNEKSLSDQTLYYWRVRAIKQDEKSDWVVSRFFVDTQSDKKFMNLTRANIKSIDVSNGYNPKNIIDWDDPGLVSFWQSTPPGDKEQWVKFSFENETEISRVWILSNPADRDGWLKDFVFEASDDDQNWEKISGSEIKNNNSFRNIIDFNPVRAKYIRLMIKGFIGYAPQINEIILYSPGKPKLPEVPNDDYVLIIGNEHNGFTFTDLAKQVESLDLNLKTITIPCNDASLEMIEQLPNQPVAIILSGNNADYPNLPMFEYNGEFEIIRKSNLPILGICAGHQFLAMAYGYTRARSMGWSDISAVKPKQKMSHIKIIKQDQVFDDITSPFIAPEIHGWAVIEPADEFEVIAQSDYIQAQKSRERFIYGIQFHAEINESYNEGKPFLRNFLTLALKHKK